MREGFANLAVAGELVEEEGVGKEETEKMSWPVLADFYRFCASNGIGLGVDAMNNIVGRAAEGKEAEWIFVQRRVGGQQPIKHLHPELFATAAAEADKVSGLKRPLALMDFWETCRGRQMKVTLSLIQNFVARHVSQRPDLAPTEDRRLLGAPKFLSRELVDRVTEDLVTLSERRQGGWRTLFNVFNFCRDNHVNVGWRKFTSWARKVAARFPDKVYNFTEQTAKSKKREKKPPTLLYVAPALARILASRAYEKFGCGRLSVNNMLAKCQREGVDADKKFILERALFHQKRVEADRQEDEQDVHKARAPFSSRPLSPAVAALVKADIETEYRVKLADWTETKRVAGAAYEKKAMEAFPEPKTLDDLPAVGRAEELFGAIFEQYKFRGVLLDEIWQSFFAALERYFKGGDGNAGAGAFAQSIGEAARGRLRLEMGYENLKATKGKVFFQPVGTLAGKPLRGKFCLNFVPYHRRQVPAWGCAWSFTAPLPTTYSRL